MANSCRKNVEGNYFAAYRRENNRVSSLNYFFFQFREEKMLFVMASMLYSILFCSFCCPRQNYIWAAGRHYLVQPPAGTCGSSFPSCSPRKNCFLYHVSLYSALSFNVHLSKFADWSLCKCSCSCSVYTKVRG